jgi:RNA polymerase sigma-70 factor (ECF subfamily)
MLADRVRRQQVVLIEAVEDLDALNIAIDTPGPEQNIIAREELRRVQAALDRLPPRARQAVILRKIDELSWHEIAEQWSRRLSVAHKRERRIENHRGNGEQHYK